MAQQTPQHPLYVEGVPAVETHDHPQIWVSAASLSQWRSDTEDSGHTVFDTLHQSPQTVLYHGPLLDLVPVLVQEGAVERVREVLTLLSQAQAVLL